MEEEKMREGIEKVMKEIGVKIKIGEIRRIEKGKREWGKMMVVKLDSENERKKEGEGKLKESKIWIMEDLM